MKPVAFVICFSLGVSLMIFSGYLPQSASARGSGGLASDESYAGGGGRTFTHPVDPRIPVSEGAPAPTAGDPVPAGVAPADPPPAGPILPPGPEIEIEENGPAAPAEPQAPPLLADAGPDRVVWSGWDELTLDGSASVGAELTYLWRQVSGPLELVIADPYAPGTTATGLLLEGERPAWRSLSYRFELTVTDAAGQTAADEVTYTVKSAPAIKLRPAGERRFDIRDGYQLAHFTAWVTNLESYETTFDITCENELTFTRVSGGEYDVTGGKVSRGYAYQVTLFPVGDELSSFIEFLVDSDEQVPAIVQLGVNWE